MQMAAKAAPTPGTWMAHSTLRSARKLSSSILLRTLLRNSISSNNGLAAEWGRTSGAVVNVVLKSGTNAFHGSLYEYNRNSYFNASNPFDRRDVNGTQFLSPHVNFNDFGGTVGGPIVKNRTFFFFSWETSFLHENKNQLYTVPTAQERGGNFSDRPDLGACPTCLYDPYSTVGPDANGLFHRTPFSGNAVPPNLIDPLAAYYVQSYPNPNFLDPLQQGSNGCGAFCNNFLGTVGSSLTTNNMSIKVDHRFNEKSALICRVSLQSELLRELPAAMVWTNCSHAGHKRCTTLHHRESDSCHRAHPDFQFDFHQRSSRKLQPAEPDCEPESQFVGRQFRDRTAYSRVEFRPRQIRPGPGHRCWRLWRLWTGAMAERTPGCRCLYTAGQRHKGLGSHTLKAGLMWRRDHNWYNASWGYGLNFGGGLTSDPVTGLGGNGLAQFLLGAVDGGGAGTFHYPYQTNDYWGFYVQDDFRVNSKLTLNIGLRYDIYGWFRERHDYLANFDFSAQNPAVPYNGRIDYFGTSAHPDSNVFPANKNSIGPRINFAWTPSNDRKWVIRGGFDVIYSNGISAAFGDQNGAISGPAYANFFAYNGDFTGQRPVFKLSQGAPNLNIPPVNQVKQDDNQFLGTTVGAFLKGDHDPYVEQYSLFVQRELPANMGISVGYVGTHGLHLFGDEFRSYDHVPTSVRQQLRSGINDTVSTPAPLVSIYRGQHFLR